ncbi:uncharacterized protein L203_103150 [Cryptococcus depauperatus CBS 7841]|uniref:UBC core domain-containing protein n=1 Tax=Cryptococcus depauperatus CBS 7841 TaxID=1295531 RepID=A0AAJ8JT58_9TREE
MPPLPPSLPGLPEDYTPQFFGNDIVAQIKSKDSLARVLRCWSDEDGILPPGHELSHPLDRPLKRGEVGISYLADGSLAIVPELTLMLFQREFRKGDLVKRSLANHESALIVDVKTQLKLKHVITGEEIQDWVPYEDVVNTSMIDSRDRVVYNNWVGTVKEVFEEGLVETPSGETYRCVEKCCFLEVGRRFEDVLPKNIVEKMKTDSGSSPQYPTLADRVLEINPVIIYVVWNAINQELSNLEQERCKEPEPFWFGENLKKLTIFSSIHSEPPSIGEVVNFIDQEAEIKYGAKFSSHAQETIKVGAMKIVESRSTLILRWQTGKEIEEPSTGFVPYHDVDDYEAWPGDHVIWRADDGQKRHVVIQTFDPFQRVAKVLFMDDKSTDFVPVMELDPGGRFGNNSYGVSIEQKVLLCDDNAFIPPEIPRLGQNETPVRNLWLSHEFAKMGNEYIKDPAKYKWYKPEGDQKEVDWWGEVVQLHLDGNVTVKLANGEQKKVGLRNISILDEPLGEMIDELGSEIETEIDLGEVLGMGNEHLSHDPSNSADVLKIFETGLKGFKHAVDKSKRQSASEASWETVSNVEENKDGHDRDMEDVDTEGEIMEVDREEEQEVRKRRKVSYDTNKNSYTASGKRPLALPLHTSRLDENEAGSSSASLPSYAPISKLSLENDEHWQSFDVLEQAPSDHHFINEKGMQVANKGFLSRIKREHNALQSSLPENIVVRAYEDRLDLIRVLIIGPEGTPYSDAPFIFDVYLNPTSFPNDPPVVHFHSHTNGHGRCNPNLYEEGKVCLSILGTWSGDEAESWNPAKSSLLQVFVSISGLVLVKSPYHCEPAFAKLEGTIEGKVNSRLYSEKAYVLSRSFVRSALDRPPVDLANEIRHFYITKGRLQSVVDHAQRLIAKGEVAREESEENTEMWNADAMGRLTMGAIITLKRVVAALQTIWDKEIR